MKHKHITPKDERWDRRKYICICGFSTGDRRKFDRHLHEKSNKPIEPTARKTPVKKLFPSNEWERDFGPFDY